MLLRLLPKLLSAVGNPDLMVVAVCMCTMQQTFSIQPNCQQIYTSDYSTLDPLLLLYSPTPGVSTYCISSPIQCKSPK